MIDTIQTFRKILLTVFIICIGITAKAEPLMASLNNKDTKHAYSPLGGITITGKVISSETREPLPGVVIVLKGTTIGTVTSAEGQYSLIIPNDTDTLLFSFIGYLTEEVPIAKRTVINLELVPDIMSLQEVVIIGYGTQTKKDLTGSIVSISKEDFNKGQNTSPEQLIVGKIAGVQVTSNGGAPGAGSQIRIRGGSSLSASNDPLIVIDGVPVDNNGIAGATNALSLINPNDIETFTVLKDASATAIYGSRASNGVIIITTKKGKNGDKLKVDFSSLFSVSQLPKTVTLLSGDEYRAVVKAYGNPASKNLLGNANTDWQDVIYRNALSQDNNLSVSGSLKALPYRLSFGYLNQDGIIETSNLQRTSTSLNLNPDLLDGHLKINLNVKGIFTNTRFVDEGAIGAAVNMDPTQPVYASNNLGGYFEWTDTNGEPIMLAPRNPLSVLEQTRNKGQANRSIGNLQLDYRFHFFPDLKANLNVGYDVSEGKGQSTLPTTLASVYTKGGSNSRYSQSKSNKLLDFYLNYLKEIKSIHSKIDVTAGYSYQDFLREEPPYPEFNAEGTTVKEANPFPFKTQNTLVSFFGRMNYSLLDRYLLTATVRQDGSSRFSPENRWGTFPSVALAWKIKNESFLKDVNLVSDLKLRVGYGVTGQQDLSALGNDYPYLARYIAGNSSVQYQFGNNFYSTYRPNPYDYNIKWEETATSNIGLDFGFANGKVTGSLDYYFKKTKDLLATVSTAAGTNFANDLVTNVGSIENKGIEVALNYKAISTDDLTWTIGINGAYNKNKITKLSKTQDSTSVGVPVGYVAGGTGNTVQIHTVGQSAYSFYVLKQVYDEKGNPIEGLYVDLNKDGIINEQDRYRYKSPAAPLAIGFNSQVTYKKWSAGFVMRASLGNYVYNNTKANAIYNNVNWPGYLLNIPRSIGTTNFVGTDSNRMLSDIWVENASFLRMDYINVGYNVGNIYKDKVNLRLSANAQNVFVISKFNGLDPEIVGGISNNVYPRPRIFSAGLTLGF